MVHIYYFETVVIDPILLVRHRKTGTKRKKRNRKSSIK